MPVVVEVEVLERERTIPFNPFTDGTVIARPVEEPETQVPRPARQPNLATIDRPRIEILPDDAPDPVARRVGEVIERPITRQRESIPRRVVTPTYRNNLRVNANAIDAALIQNPEQADYLDGAQKGFFDGVINKSIPRSRRSILEDVDLTSDTEVVGYETWFEKGRNVREFFEDTFDKTRNGIRDILERDRGEKPDPPREPARQPEKQRETEPWKLPEITIPKLPEIQFPEFPNPFNFEFPWPEPAPPQQPQPQPKRQPERPPAPKRWDEWEPAGDCTYTVSLRSHKYVRWDSYYYAENGTLTIPGEAKITSDPIPGDGKIPKEYSGYTDIFGNQLMYLLAPYGGSSSGGRGTLDGLGYDSAGSILILSLDPYPIGVFVEELTIRYYPPLHKNFKDRVRYVIESLQSSWYIGGKVEYFQPIFINVYCSAPPPRLDSPPPPPPPPKEPPPPPPPPPRPRRRKDNMSCCPPVNYALIAFMQQQVIENMRYEVSIPVVTCEQNSAGIWEPKSTFKTVTVFAPTAEIAAQQAEIHKQQALMAVQLCEMKNGASNETLEKIATAIGVDEYPATLPASLIATATDFNGNYQEPGTVEIPNLTRFMEWYVKRFDEIMGQWQVPIQVKDADPTTPGDQPVGMKIPNIAEAFAELFGLVFQTAINSETLVNIGLKNLVETGQVKQQGFKSYYQLDSIIDYLNFNTKEVKQKLPLSFTPGKEKLEEILTPIETEVLVQEINDTNTLKISLGQIGFMESVIRAVYWRQVDPNGDIKQQLINQFKKHKDFKDKLDVNAKDENDKDDFDNFIDAAEIAYQGGAVPVDNKPYGRNFSERPRIIRYGQGETDGNDAGA